MYDLKIINGDVLDGTGSNALSINIAIKDGVIVELGDCNGEAKTVIDAEPFRNIWTPLIVCRAQLMSLLWYPMTPYAFL